MSDAIEVTVHESAKSAADKFVDNCRESEDGYGLSICIRPVAAHEGHGRALVVMVAMICDCSNPACIYRGALDLATDLIEARLQEKSSRKADDETPEVEMMQ